MPSSYVASLAKEKNIPLNVAEDRWERAKASAEKQGHKDDYDYITGIFKNMMGESFIREAKNQIQSVDYWKTFLTTNSKKTIKMVVSAEAEYKFLYNTKRLNMSKNEVQSFVNLQIAADELGLTWVSDIMKDMKSAKSRTSYLENNNMKVNMKEKINKLLEKVNTIKEKVSLNESSSEQVADTILQQLGGAGRLKAMIGAYNFGTSYEGFGFRFKAPARKGINYIKIVIDSRDTYTIMFYRLSKSGAQEIETIDDIYANQLKQIIEERTGLALSL